MGKAIFGAIKNSATPSTTKNAMEMSTQDTKQTTMGHLFTSTDVNPLDTNLVFSYGQLALIVVVALLALSAVTGFVARIAGLTRLDIETEKATSRLLAIFLYAVLIWLGLSMLIGYLGNSILDVINGIILLVGVVTSLIQRGTSDQASANRTLAFLFGFVAVMILWSFIYGAVMDALPKTFVDSVGREFHTSFFSDALKYWHIMQ